MNFSGVKAISIPQGNVIKIQSGDTVLWESGDVTDLFRVASNFYYSLTNGGHSSEDKNWVSTDKIWASPGDYVDYKIVGHHIVASVAAYDERNQVIGYAGYTEDNELFSGRFICPDGTTYITMTGASPTFVPLLSKQQYAYLHRGGR